MATHEHTINVALGEVLAGLCFEPLGMSEFALAKRLDASRTRIARLVKGRTTFAIAHRLSTLRSADRLVVLDEGRIAETGTHEELMRKRGIFHSLVEAQRATSRVLADEVPEREAA